MNPIVLPVAGCLLIAAFVAIASYLDYRVVTEAHR